MALSFFLGQPSELRKPSKPSIIMTLSLLCNGVCIMEIPSGEPAYESCLGRKYVRERHAKILDN